MYDAKQQGRNNFQFFRREMNARRSNCLLMESDLRQALKKGSSNCTHQPQLDFGSGEIVSLRPCCAGDIRNAGWFAGGFHSDGGGNRLIVDRRLGHREACRQLASWRATDGPALRVAPNLSVAQFREKDLHVRIANALIASDLPAEAIRNRGHREHPDERRRGTAATLRALDAMGVRIAIDDFEPATPRSPT